MKKGRIIETIATVLAVVATKVFFGGWLVMIVTGMLHHEVSTPSVPAYSYRASVFLGIGLTVLAGFFHTHERD